MGFLGPMKGADCLMGTLVVQSVTALLDYGFLGQLLP